MLFALSINILFIPVYALKSQLQSSLFFLLMSLAEIPSPSSEPPYPYFL